LPSRRMNRTGGPRARRAPDHPPSTPARNARVALNDRASATGS
jgi:hypothetical protein